MKNYTSNESGFTALEIILTIVVLAAIGAAVFFGLKAHDSATNKDTAASVSTPVASASPSNSSSPTSTPSLPSFVFDISDLGLKFTAPGEYAGLTYQVVHLAGDQAVNSVALSTKTLTTTACPISTAPLGYLTYDSDKGGQKVANARNSTLYYIAPTGACAASNYSALQAALQTLVSDGGN